MFKVVACLVYNCILLFLFISSSTGGTDFWFLMWKVDLTAYVEKHEFCFDAVLDENVTNDEVIQLLMEIEVAKLFFM